VKWRYLSAAVLLLLAFFRIRHVRDVRLRAKREASYLATLNSYSRESRLA
jgi:hypothetical protein